MPFRKITFALIGLGALVFGNTVHAQVAVPSIVPATPRVGVTELSLPDAEFAPENPGAMPFGTPSAIGYGQIEAESENPAGTRKDYSGSYGGLRWVADGFSFGAEVVEIAADDNSYSAKATNAALAIPIGDPVGIGIGFNRWALDFGSVEITLEELLGGIAVSIDETIFLGVVMGRQTFDFTDSATPADNFDDTRDILKYGAGLRSGSSDIAWHLEYYAIAADSVKNAAGNRIWEFDSQTVVAEMIWKGLLIALSATEFSFEDDDGRVQILDFGWAPQEGIALLGHLERNELENPAGNKTKIEVTAVSIAFQF